MRPVRVLHTRELPIEAGLDASEIDTLADDAPAAMAAALDDLAHRDRLGRHRRRQLVVR